MVEWTFVEFGEFCRCPAPGMQSRPDSSAKLPACSVVEPEFAQGVLTDVGDYREGEAPAEPLGPKDAFQSALRTV